MNRRALAALATLAAVLLVAFTVPATRGFLDESVIEPVRAQADPAPGLVGGYSPMSLAFWALIGAVLGWVGYELVFVQMGIVADRRFFLSLAPLLVFGPLSHALLASGAIPQGTFLAYAASEPLVYVTTAVLLVAGLAIGARFDKAREGMLAVGVLALAPALIAAARFASAANAGRVAGLVAIALVAAAAVTWLSMRFLRTPRDAVFALVGAHALDGATTWLSLRDPFGWGFSGFSESNPVSETLVNLQNGWPYFALKLALPLILLFLMRTDGREHPAEDARPAEQDARMMAFLMFAIFVLGYGPGMSNLLQVLLA